MLGATYSYGVKIKKSVLTTGLLVVSVFISLLVSTSSIIQAPASAKGGTPGETWVVSARYTPETCPIPETIKKDYETILTCTLSKRAGQTRDFFIRVDGFTQLLPVVRDIRATSKVLLPCGNIATISKFTESAFAQTSPVPPPYRLYTESAKIADTCIL